MSQHILMVAAENDALPGGKVGGIGDVVRDVPKALVERGFSVTVITPAYGVFSHLPDAERLAALEVGFGGTSQHVELYQVLGSATGSSRLRHLVLDHPLFASGGRGRIYCDDPPNRPYASDATKFALFCAATAEATVRGAFGQVDIIHLHDWHAALLLVLRRYHPAFRALQTQRCVYTIHNLALQGIRPFANDSSSLAAWYPGLNYEHGLLTDPRYVDCINPMAVGIRLADKVHTVSPSYAEEILRPSAVETKGYYGGEGLEADLHNARAEGRLHGILNGCDYAQAAGQPAGEQILNERWPALLTRLGGELLRWSGQQATVASAHFIANNRLATLGSERPPLLLTSIGRLTEQKLRLLRQPLADGRSALHGVLDVVADHGGLFLLLGSGDSDYEAFFTQAAGERDRFIYLRGYSDALSRQLYSDGDLFLMPSSFEPCGISQMLAMRAGQPCLVHHVGGLRDTVTPGVNGFAFGGSQLLEQAEALVTSLGEALTLRRQRPERWQALRANAAAARFLWADSVDAYIERLYYH